MKTLSPVIRKILKKDSRLWTEDATPVLLKAKLIELLTKDDEELLSLLINNSEVEKHFFKKVGQVTIFQKDRFIQLVTMNEFLPSSFTAFENKIGLAKNGKLLSQNDDIFLVFPHKDCVLEGGQTKEEQKRDEIFYNTVLAPDEVDRLKEPKVFTNTKRISANERGEIVEEEITEISETDNMIIKGNNLMALYSLLPKYRGKIKLIYIDPPYNTGNDGFKYNDNFNHSAWLTFMKNRLKTAKELLATTGTIAISIDNNEQSYLQVLLDEVFGSKNKKNLITVKRSSVSGAKVINNGVVNVSEYIVIYSRNTNNWKPNKVFRAKDRDSRYNKFIVNRDDNYEKWEYITVLEAFASFQGIKKSQLRKSLGNEYEIELENFIFENSKNIIRFAALDDKAIGKTVRDMKKISKTDSSKTYIIEREKFSNYFLYKGEAILFFEDRLIKLNGKKEFGELITDIWDDVLPNDLHNEGGVSFKKGKKPEKLLQRLIELFSNKNDIVLDYHLGSGTTCAVSHKINRQYIGIEQMDYGENDSLVRMINTINNEQSGITKSVNWQGGGNFVYTELLEWNQKYIDMLEKVKTDSDIEKIRGQIEQEQFYKYQINLDEFEETEFSELSLEDKKRVLIDVLDLNHLYVNINSIDDSIFGVSDIDKELNKNFYNLDK